MILPFLLLAALGAYLFKTRTSNTSTPALPSKPEAITTSSVARTPTTPSTLDEDLAELPADVRDYVMSFVIDHATPPSDFDDGAHALVAGCPPGVEETAAVGLDYSPVSPSAKSMPPSYNLPSSGKSTFAYPQAPAPPSEPSYSLPINPTAPETSEPLKQNPKPAVGPAKTEKAIPDAHWCYPRAAARLRKIAQEKRAEVLAGTKGIDSHIVHAGLQARLLSRPSDVVTEAVAYLPDDVRSRFLRSRVEAALRSFQNAQSPWDVDYDNIRQLAVETPAGSTARHFLESILTSTNS